MNKKISTPSNRPVAPVHPPFVRGTQAPLNYTADSRFSAIFDCAEFTGYSPDPGGRSPPKLHNFNFDFPSLSLSSTLLIIEQRATGDDLNAHVYRPCQLIVSNLAY
ncbi:hypothetical protein PGTUg99_007029 [Puccinia graminis f. sp. tritici]|uniref:Uncharacterized protein n=1 Tax=Puccinia graminis f. sp. tritici TaxID=56615 RepID=A0A5B0MQZ3_PUCGR|nr:hypothetical protein PGTUg99_007029 [Puccinia graminis f. sp. tritici]